MTIHKEGRKILIILIIFLVILNYSIRSFSKNELLEIFIFFASLFIFLLILQFFRSPNRKIIYSDKYVIAPADGKVVVIEKVLEEEFFNEWRMQVSIFMSPLNVHVNRYPVSGKISCLKYHPGKYLVAWHPKSSTENERTSIVIDGSHGFSILVKQIAGALARRICYYGKEGDEVKQGDELGFIKFGSRVDMLLPLDCKINVSLDDKVKGGETILAYI